MKKERILTIVFCSFILIFSVLTILLPKKAESANEKRVLASFPEVSLKTITDGSFMTGFDTYVADHFAFRDKWVGAYAYATKAVGLNGINGVYAGKDGYLIAAPMKYSDEFAKKNISNLLTFADKNDISCTLLVVPSTGYILDDKLPKFHKDYYDDELFETIKKETEANKNFSFIDTRDTIKEEASRSTPLYYRTDHHINSYGALLLYNEYCKAKGLTPEKFSLTRTYSDFYGTSYSKSGLWLTKPDNVDVYEAKEPSDFTVTIDGKDYDSLYFPEKLKTADKYEYFLNGNHALTVIKNNSNENGQKLLLIKDSFSHCFATYLAENYEEIVMVDLRYYRDSTSALIDEYGITDVLFLYGTENMATSTDFGWLNY